MSVTAQNRDIKALQPVAQIACNLFMAECKKVGVKVFITETQRSQARQDWLYEQGRTRPGDKVTWTRNSNNKTGYAWDIACSPPQYLWEDKVFRRAGKVAAKLGIEWGGNWGTYDGPHFQVNKNWIKPKGGYAVQDTSINLNGKVKTVKTVNIDGNNFIKLQDLRDDKIIIDYNAVAKIPVIKIK